MALRDQSYYTLRVYVEPALAATRAAFKRLEADWPKVRHFDAGVDLVVPAALDIPAHARSVKVDHGIACSMETSDDYEPVCYYLYCRSSTGSKTPLRLANSVGIIDSGYRGHITGVFDNLSDQPYHIEAGDRLLQICGPTLDRPIRVIVVDSFAELGAPTVRGTGGFGSTGK